MRAAVHRIGAGLWWLSAASAWSALAFMAVIGAADVLGTALLGRPLPGTFEMSEQALAALIFLGLLHTQIRRSHIVVDILTERLRGWPARLSGALALSATALALGLIAAPMWLQFTDSLAIREQAPGALGFPVWPVKGLVSVAALAATLVAVAQAGLAWRHVLRPDPPLGAEIAP